MISLPSAQQEGTISQRLCLHRPPLLRTSDLGPAWDSSPAKGGDKAYGLLRQALADSGKVAVAKVVIKTRQHLAAVKPQQRGLMLELMHFPEELLDTSDFKAPAPTAAGKAEINMAKKLIESMSAKWHPDLFKDDYQELLEKVVEEKVRKGGKPAPEAKPRRKAADVIDLVSVLQQSIHDAQRKSPSKPLKKAA